MSYAIHRGYNSHRFERRMGAVGVVVIGLIIGVCLGLYVAAMSIPAPSTQIIYTMGAK